MPTLEERKKAVVLRLKNEISSQGRFYGYPPTGRRVEKLQVGVVKVVDGKIAEAWYLGDELGLLLQTDALSALSGNAP